MTHNTIQINNLSIGYKHGNNVDPIVQGLSSVIYSGELTCLLGANGVGKSTLLRTLAAFQPKLQGDIIILGKNIDDYSEKELATTISIVLTERCDVRVMSVIELVSMGRTPYTGFWGRLNHTDKEAVQKAISLVKIEQLANKQVETLSDGEKQKVMIAKALAQDTPVVFLDEPSAFLDFPSKVDIMLLLHRLSRQTNKIIFLSTHDLELALQTADKIWLLDKKTGITTGTPEELAANGSISSFVQHKDIHFDTSTNLFHIIKSL